MEPKYLFRIAGTLLLLAMVGQAGAADMPERVVLTLFDDPATTMGVTWRTQDAVEAPVAQLAAVMPDMNAEAVPPEMEGKSRYLQFDQYATSVPAETRHVVAGEDETVHYHTARFTGLTPDTVYLYRVGAGEAWSEWNQFRTAPASARPYRFLYYGDAQNDIRMSWSHLARASFRHVPDAAFMLYGGDLVGDGEEDADWDEWFGALGWACQTMPVLATPGNHEYFKPSEDKRELAGFWHAQFAFPENGPGGLEEEAWYLDYGDARIISLNSNEDPAVQREWVERALRDAGPRWTIVTFHHPIYSSGRGRDNPELREAWMPVFEQAGADLVLSGHDHTYARTPRLAQGAPASDGGPGVVYLNSVSGPKQYAFNPLHAEVFRRTAEGTQLFQAVSVSRDALRVESRTADGALYDAFELRRTGDRVRYIDEAPQTPERRRADAVTAAVTE